MTVDRFAGFIVRHRSAGVLAAVCVAVVSIAGAPRLRFDFSFRPFFLSEDVEAPILASLAEEFRNPAGASLVAVLHGEDVLSPVSLAAIEATSRAVEALPHVERVVSAATVPYLRGDGRSIGMETLPRIGATDAALALSGRPAVVDNPLWRRRLVSPDGTATPVVATLERGFEGVLERREVIAAFRRAVEDHLPRGFRAEFAGYAIAESAYAQSALGGMAMAQGVATLVMAGVLYLCFGTLAGVLVPLTVVSLATLATVGMMGFAGLPLTFTTVSVPLLIVVIGVAETSFFMACFYEEHARGGPATEVARRVIARMLIPSAVAAVTTAAAFLSLWTGHISLTRDFGTAMATGELATVAVTLLILPAALTRVAAGAAAAPHGISLERPLAALGDFVLRRSTAILACGAAVMLVGILGISRIRVEQYATRELPAAHPLRTAQAAAERDLMGAFELRVATRSHDGGRITTPAGLEMLGRLQEFLARQAGVIKTWSVVDYLEEVHFALAASGPQARRLPDEPALIPQYLLLLRSIGQRVDVPELLDPSDHWASIGLGIADIGAGGLERLWLRTRSFVDEALGGGLDVFMLGDYWLVTRGIASVTRDFVRSIAASLLVVFLVVAVFLGSWRLTLLSIVPNVIPMMAALALMGFGGIHLRVGTAIMLPVSLGIAVDATVHYLARAREEARLDGARDLAAVRALTGAGRGIAFSGAALVAGFACLMLPDLRVFRDVSLLGMTTLGTAAAADLVLTPALFARFGPTRAQGPALFLSPSDVSWNVSKARSGAPQRLAAAIHDERGSSRGSTRWRTAESARRPQFGNRRT